MKNVSAVRLVERDDAAEVVDGLPDELRVSLSAIAGVAREGVLAVSASVGLMVMHEMMTAEMAAKVGGAKHAKVADRRGNWHGDAPGSVVLGGRRVPVDRQRGRTLDGREIELDTLRPVRQRRSVVGAGAGSDGRRGRDTPPRPGERTGR